MVITKDDFSFGYVGEPESNKEKLKSMESSDDTKTNNDEEETDLNSSRKENLHRCKCSICIVMPTFIECRCYKEFKGLLDGKVSAGCVTNHEAFDYINIEQVH